MKTSVANGQLSIFDINDGTRPCEYRFKRYIGQRVIMTIGGGYTARKVRGVITAIGPYYTYVRTPVGELCATPSSIIPEEEYADANN